MCTPHTNNDPRQKSSFFFINIILKWHWTKWRYPRTCCNYKSMIYTEEKKILSAMRAGKESYTLAEIVGNILRGIDIWAIFSPKLDFKSVQTIGSYTILSPYKDVHSGRWQYCSAHPHSSLWKGYICTPWWPVLLLAELYFPAPFELRWEWEWVPLLSRNFKNHSVVPSFPFPP